MFCKHFFPGLQHILVEIFSGGKSTAQWLTLFLVTQMNCTANDIRGCFLCDEIDYLRNKKLSQDETSFFVEARKFVTQCVKYRNKCLIVNNAQLLHKSNNCRASKTKISSINSFSEVMAYCVGGSGITWSRTK